MQQANRQKTTAEHYGGFYRETQFRKVEISIQRNIWRVQSSHLIDNSLHHVPVHYTSENGLGVIQNLFFSK